MDRHHLPQAPVCVLLVEDHETYRESLQLLVGSTPGMRCRAAGNAGEALALIADERPDVVVMDIDLPGTNGIDLTRAIKAAYPRVQVLMCTVFEDEEKIFKALKAGATGYIVKRAPIRELLEAIEQVHAGGSPMSAGIARKVVSTFHQPSLSQEGLTTREQEVLERVAEGLSVKEIADRMQVSHSTVRTHIRHIYEKLQVHSRVEAVNRMRGG
jgi:DNA-binding NarL/FixJ family response regulator